VHDRRGNQFESLLDLISGLPRRLQSGSDPIYRDGMGEAGIFRDSDFTHNTSGYSCPLCRGDSDSSAQGTVCSSPSRRAMDLSNMVVCVSDRGDRISDAVSPLSFGQMSPAAFV
jgi:hypothetical protein